MSLAGGGEDVVDCGWVLLIIIQYDTCRTACTTLVKGTSELEGWMDGHTDVLYDAAQATYRACCTRRLSV